MAAKAVPIDEFEIDLEDELISTQLEALGRARARNTDVESRDVFPVQHIIDRNQRFNHASQFLRLRYCGFYSFMAQQRSGHIPKHGFAM